MVSWGSCGSAGSSSLCLEVSPPLYVFSEAEGFVCPSAPPWVDHCPSEGSKHRENAGFFGSPPWLLMKKRQSGVTSADTTQLRWRGPSQAGSCWRSHCFLLPGTFWSCESWSEMGNICWTHPHLISWTRNKTAVCMSSYETGQQSHIQTFAKVGASPWGLYLNSCTIKSFLGIVLFSTLFIL